MEYGIKTELVRMHASLSNDLRNQKISLNGCSFLSELSFKMWPHSNSWYMIIYLFFAFPHRFKKPGTSKTTQTSSLSIRWGEETKLWQVSFSKISSFGRDIVSLRRFNNFCYSMCIFSFLSWRDQYFFCDNYTYKFLYYKEGLTIALLVV